MRVRTDHRVSADYQSLFRQQRMLHAHLPHIVKMRDLLFRAEIPAHFTLDGCLDILVGGKMIHHHGHLVTVIHPVKAHFLKFTDRNRRGNVVAQHTVKLYQNQFPCLHMLHAGMRREDLLCHGHPHSHTPPCYFSLIIAPRSAEETIAA